MTEVPQIVDLSAVLEPHLNGGKLVSYTSRYLTKAGDNYGSVMLAIMANIQKTSGEIEELPLVAKLPPITNDLFWQMFQPERTCLTENAVYKFLSPAIRSLQLEAGVQESELFDGFPIYYGSRISLNPNSRKVDRDAVLVQENLQTSGFKAGNRHTPFDMAQTKLILREMAKYHALPLSLRLKKPQEFDKLIRPYFKRFNMNTGMSPEVKAQMEAELYQETANATNNNANCVERVKELMKEYDTFVAQPDKEDDLFTSIVHCDMWINNLMLQYDENGQPSKVKFVDFQIAQYESCVHDIIFFLFSSIDIPILEHHIDELLQLYYQTFIKCLKSVDVCTDEYSFVGFMKEIHKCAPVEICHALFMTKIILADNSTMPDNYKDINMDVLSRNVGKKNITEKTAHIIRIAQNFMKEIHKCAPVEICHALFMTKIILADNSTMPDNYKDINMDVLSRNVGKKNITEKTAHLIRIAQNFMKEIHKCAPVEICHALFMTKIILADNSTMPDNYKDINMDVLSRNVGKKNITEKTAHIIRIAQNFMKEIHKCAPVEICHALFMTKIILADNSTMPDNYKDINMDVLSRNVGKKNITEKTAHIIRIAQNFMKEIHKCAPVEICHALFMTKIILADNSTMPDNYKDINMDVLSRNVGKKNITEKTAHIIRIAQNFMKEIHKCAPVEICHALFMTKIILADNSTMPDNYKDINMDVLSRNVGKKNITEKTAHIIRIAQNKIVR